jgi:hypothetical protein
VDSSNHTDRNPFWRTFHGSLLAAEGRLNNPFRFRLVDFLGRTRSSLGVPLSACSLEQAL